MELPDSCHGFSVISRIFIANCIYCGNYANSRDHFIPWSYNHSGKRKRAYKNEKENIYPACLECNSIANDKVFNTIEDKRAYIASRLEKKYKKVINIPDWSDEELKEMGIKLRNNIKIKILAKKWVINRISYPNIIYPEEPIRAQLTKIIKLFGQ